MLEHTPPPWHIVQAEIGPGIVADNGIPVAQIYSPFSDVEKELGLLLKAAPKLLSACQRMVNEYKCHYRLEHCQDWERAAIHQMERAIAEATGGKV